MPCAAPEATCVFEQLHHAWIEGDFAGFMALCDKNIVWIVHLDGIQAPFASSAVGKEDLRWRLQHMMDTFSIDGFSILQMEHGAETCRSAVHIFYVHRATGEPLDVIVRFSGSQRDGVLVRVDEQADAAYVAAYTRFVRYLEDNKRGSG